MLFASVCLWIVLSACVFVCAADAAENLHMREGISFFHDLDQGFPILGDKMEDAQIANGKPTLLFFGAPGDLNTNRQAKRIVDLYRRYRTETVKFVIVDVDNATTQQARLLIKNYYPGYIPAQIIFDKQGKPKWNHTGEVDATIIGSHLDKLL